MKINKFVFKRHEIKYRLTPEQYAIVLREIDKYLYVDEYGETTIQSLYYDTDTWLLIRNSIEKPAYKEKIRARSYGLATPETKVFLELKKKLNKIVYKRRIKIKEKELAPLIRMGVGGDKGQIEREIVYFCRFYKNLKPAMLLLYDRTAHIDKNSDLRVTFDRNIRYRTERLSLCSGLDGKLILPEGEVMMEIKTAGAYPMWLVKLLNDNGIYKTSFSKYGTAYKMEILGISENDNHKNTATEVKAV
ncbi:MAG: polyphosphate polymerase domain-containing protein [Clostridia bacterium]|nr:polyphosphate polymerase domain-containing protein [Clostridia bacterium]